MKVKVYKLKNTNPYKGLPVDYSKEIEKLINSNTKVIIEEDNYYLINYKVVEISEIYYIILEYKKCED